MTVHRGDDPKVLGLCSTRFIFFVVGEPSLRKQETDRSAKTYLNNKPPSNERECLPDVPRSAR